MDASDHASWLVDHAADLGFNAIWFSPMCETTKVEKIAHGKTLTGSYYAIRDHFRIDPEFSAGDPAQDIEHLKHFCAKAAEKNIRVYADLVFNHVAADHPLVETENAAIKDITTGAKKNLRQIRGSEGDIIGLSYEDGAETKTFYFKFRRQNDFSLLIGGPPEDPWSDVAQINYSSPEAKRFFVEGDASRKAYFKQVIDWYIDCGFKGFRCDAAYLVPPEIWQTLISYTKDRLPDSLFLAETLCQTPEKVDALAKAVITDASGKERPAFDLGMLGLYWWNMRDSWLPEGESPRIQAMSKFGGAGSPDNHDTDGTLAGNLRKAFNASRGMDDAEARVCLRNYAISVLACNSSYMQMGYEYCNEKQNSVFKGMTGPEDWKNLCKERSGNGHILDLSEQIREINTLKQNLHVENCRAVFKKVDEKQNDRVIKLHCEYIDVDTNQKTAEIILLINEKPEMGSVNPVNGAASELEKSNLKKMEIRDTGEGIEAITIYHTPVAGAAEKKIENDLPQKIRKQRPPQP